MIFLPLIKYKCKCCLKDFNSKDTRVYCSVECFRTDKKKIKKVPKKRTFWPKGNTAWNKGLPNPTAAENGRRSAAKQSATVTVQRRW